MPLAQFGGEVIVVRNTQTLQHAMEYLHGQRIVGVDTETRPSFVHGQHYPTALLQIATEQRCYLFQLKHIGFTEELAALFADKTIRKVGLALRDDLRGLQRLHGFTPANCTDLQQIVSQYGILDLGLQKVFAIVFGKKISKSQQLTNWENMVLTDEQARYASTDAWATLLIYKELLRTKPISRRAQQELMAADKQRLIELQREKMLQKQQEHDNNISEKA